MGRKLYDEHGNEVIIKQRKSRLKGCLTWIMGIIVVLVVASFFVDETDTKKESSNDQVASDSIQAKEDEEDSKEQVNSYSVGDNLQIGDLGVKVLELRKVGSIPSFGDDIIPKTGNFLLVDVEVENKGNQSATLDSSNFKLYKGDTEYKSDSSAMIYVNEDSTSFFLNSLNPEAKLTGTVVFDISEASADDPNLQMQIQSGIFGGEKERVNLNK